MRIKRETLIVYEEVWSAVDDVLMSEHDVQLVG